MVRPGRYLHPPCAILIRNLSTGHGVWRRTKMTPYGNLAPDMAYCRVGGHLKLREKRLEQYIPPLTRLPAALPASVQGSGFGT
eukprot:3935293-Rhodomonas_salina.1